MKKPRLLQENQTEFPRDSSVAAESDQGARLDVRNAVVGLPRPLIGDLADGGRRRRHTAVLGGGDC